MSTPMHPPRTRRSRSHVLFALFTLLAIALPARAQDSGGIIAAGVGVGYVVLGVASVRRLAEGSTEVSVGSDVRVTIANGRPRTLRGRLTAIDRDSLTLRGDSGEVRFARGDVRSMALYKGQESKWAQGWAIGFVTGATVGGIAGLASGDTHNGGDIFDFSAEENGVFGAVFGAITGSMLGAGIGALTQGDHWRDVDRIPMPPPRVGITPMLGARRGLAIRVSF